MSKPSSPNASRSSKAGQLIYHLRTTIGRFLSSASAHVPLLLFLSGCALYLEEHEALVALDSGMVAMVSTQLKSQAQISGVTPSDDVIAVFASQQMFAELFDRTLPINRNALADLISAIAKEKPKVIAIDVDVSRLSERGCETVPRDDGRLHRTIIETVRSGISVTAVRYPNHYAHDSKGGNACLDQLQDDANRAAAEWAANHKDAPRPRFLLASPDLDIDEQPGVVVRFENPIRTTSQHTDTECKPLTPALGVAASMLGEIVTEDLRDRLWYAIENPSRCHQTNLDQHGEHHEPKHYLIDFFHAPKQLLIDKLDQVTEFSNEIVGRVVVVGIDSFENTDRHLTPLGPQRGAVIHAAIANSMKRPIQEAHGWAVLLDLVAGIAFLHLFKLTKNGCSCLSGTRILNETVMLTGPVIALAGSFLLSLHFISYLISNNLWVNPLPIILGLCIHLYLEYAENAMHNANKASSSISHDNKEPSLLDWLIGKAHTLKIILHELRSHSNETSWEKSLLIRVDDILWIAFHVFFFVMMYPAVNALFHTVWR